MSKQQAVLHNRDIAPASLTEGLVSILRRPVDTATRRRAAFHALDWIGCAAAGARTEAALPFIAWAGQLPKGPVVSVAGADLSAHDAAFVDGAFGTLLEMDDVYKAAVLHPGPVVMPAVLAAAQARRPRSGALFDAVIRGYEAVIRLGCSVGAGHYRYFHNTATCGPIGAAAGVGDLIGLDDRQLVSALGNALTRTGGLWQCRHEPVMSKMLHTAWAAQSGLQAAEMAALGLTGPRFILEGPQGFYAAMAPDAKPDALLGVPDGPWRIDDCSIKPWPACRHTHAAIDAALAIRSVVGAGEIASVVVRIFSDALVFCDNREPQTTPEARFSVQHAVALALVDGPPTPSGLEPACLFRDDLVALRRRVSLVVDSVYEETYPARFGSGLTITMADGRTIGSDIPDAWGDPENPLSEDDMAAKSSGLCLAAGMPRRLVDELVARMLSASETDQDSPALFELLRKAFGSIHF